MRSPLLLLLLLLVLGARPGFGARRRRSSSPVAPGEAFFRSWSSAATLETFAKALAKPHSRDKLAKVTVLGKSAEKRPIYALSVGAASPRYQLVLMAGMHGREWITPHATLYVAMRLIQGYENGDRQATELLKETQVHFIPLINPDGYEFTRTPKSKNEAARQWRKNRRNLCSTCERAVHGIDLNRNWGIKGLSWGFGNNKATTEVYQGRHPFSEPEIKAIRDWLLHKGRGKSVNAFLDVHCCSGAILPPFYYRGESEDVQMKNLENCKHIAKAMHGVNDYKYKWRQREKEFSASNTGVGVDWIHAEAGVENTFIVETRGNRTKLLKDIFEVPEDEIIPISRELEAGFWKMAELFANTRPSLVPSAELLDADENNNEEEEEEKKEGILEGPQHRMQNGLKEEEDTDDTTKTNYLRHNTNDMTEKYKEKETEEEEVNPSDMSLEELLAAFSDPSIMPKKMRDAQAAAKAREEIDEVRDKEEKDNQEAFLHEEKKEDEEEEEDEDDEEEEEEEEEEEDEEEEEEDDEDEEEEAEEEEEEDNSDISLSRIDGLSQGESENDDKAEDDPFEFQENQEDEDSLEENDQEEDKDEEMEFSIASGNDNEEGSKEEDDDFFDESKDEGRGKDFDQLAYDDLDHDKLEIAARNILGESEAESKEEEEARRARREKYQQMLREISKDHLEEMKLRRGSGGVEGDSATFKQFSGALILMSGGSALIVVLWKSSRKRWKGE